MHVNVTKDFWNLFRTMIRCRCMCALCRAKEKGHVKRYGNEKSRNRFFPCLAVTSSTRSRKSIGFSIFLFCSLRTAIILHFPLSRALTARLTVIFIVEYFSQDLLLIFGTKRDQRRTSRRRRKCVTICEASGFCLARDEIKFRFSSETRDLWAQG